jgi:hypothetical protein
MAKKKFPIEWVLAFASVPVIIIAFALFMVFSRGTETASTDAHANVKKVVRIYPKLKADYTTAMSDKKLSVNEANAILAKANRMTKKGSSR